MTNMKAYFYELIEEIRPFLIGLSEAPVLTENVIQGTATGDKNGDYASQLYESAAFSQLNSKPKLDAIETSLKPLSQKLRNFAKL